MGCINQKEAEKEVKRETQGPQPSSQEANPPKFIANVREMHQYYVKLVLHVRESRLFETRSQRLISAVKKYFQASFKFDRDDLDVASVDAVRKLHPYDYWNKKIDEEWLISACLRQQKFSDETKVQKITYDHAFPEYLQFLRICRYNFMQKNGAITVPTKCQDVIWHSHMLDPQNYKKDMINYMGKLLNHMDDIPEDELKKHSQRTKEIVKEINVKSMGNPVELKEIKA